MLAISARSTSFDRAFIMPMVSSIASVSSSSSASSASAMTSSSLDFRELYLVM